MTVTPPSARRLDYIFVGESLVPSLKDSLIKSIGFSDHRMVITTFEFSSFKRGKGIYKLNTCLLNDADYIHLICKVIFGKKTGLCNLLNMRVVYLKCAFCGHFIRPI